MRHKRKKCKIILTERERQFVQLMNPYSGENRFMREVALIMGISVTRVSQIKLNILRKRPDFQKLFDNKKTIRAVARRDRKRFKVVDGVQQLDALDIAVSFDESMEEHVKERF